jgi:hypothetical protein
VGTVVLAGCLLLTWLAYRARPTGGSPDETSVLWKAVLVTSALSFGLYLLGVVRGQRSYNR